MHALARQFQIPDLARLGRILDAVNFDPRLVGHAIGDRLVEIGPFLVLNQNVADDLHLMGVGIRRVGHLGDQTRLGGIGDVENAQRHRRSAKMSQINVAAMLEQLHAIAMAVQIVMADHPHIQAFALGLDGVDFSAHDSLL